MRLIIVARSENAGLVAEMCKRGHEVLMPDAIIGLFRQAGLPVQPINMPQDPNAIPGYLGLTMEQKIQCIVSAAPQVIDAVTASKADAVVVWTDAPPLPRLMVLAARARGIPTFEITHGSFNTYRQGHFETESYVDYVLAPGQEEVDFRAFYGSKANVVVTGKPTLDWTTTVDKPLIRSQLCEQAGITRRPIVMYGMTWRHPFSTWERDKDLGESEVFSAHKMLLNVCKPYLIIKPHPVMANMAERVRAMCDEAGMTDYAVSTMPVSSILPGCDLLVSHNSSLLVEGILCDIPSVCFSFREWNDHRFHSGKGVECIEKREDLLAAMARCLLDAPTKDRLAQERVAAKHYFNGPNDGHATERVLNTIEKLAVSRVEACA